MGIKGIFDSHAHYDDERFGQDRDRLLNQLFKDGLYAICNITTDLKSFETSKKLTQKYEKIYTTAGIHPQYANKINQGDLKKIIELANYEKTVAIGEIGLDYHYDKKEKNKQIELFKKQMDIAKELGLPVVIHSREAASDTMDILKAYRGVKGVVHCFSYSNEFAKQVIDLGYKIGITGVVTFKNAKKVVDVVEKTPIDQIVIETDCPYLTPEPNRGKRNDSSSLYDIVKQISKLKGIQFQEVVDKTRQNAKQLYNL